MDSISLVLVNLVLLQCCNTGDKILPLQYCKTYLTCKTEGERYPQGWSMEGWVDGPQLSITITGAIEHDTDVDMLADCMPPIPEKAGDGTGGG